MQLGLLPAFGSGIRDLKASGQDSRLIDGYLKPYSAAFGTIWYFSYLPEALTDYSDDPSILASVRLLAPRRPMPPLLRALTVPLSSRGAWRGCDVVRTFQLTGIIPALVARALWGTPFVTTYGFWYGRLARSARSRSATRLLERVGLRVAAGVIVPTEELRAHVASLTGPGRVHMIPNGVDTSRFAPGNRVPRRVRRILYVGRLEAEKNLSCLVTAAAKLVGRFQLRLVFVGAGSMAASLDAQAKAAAVEIEFLGVVDHRRLPDLYRDSDVFVLPSFTEGHPKVLIEAMATGVPCVASSCSGNRALVRDGQTGLLFDPASSDALTAALERVLGDESFAISVGRQAREAVVRDYELSTLVAREIALLKRVAHGRTS